MLLPVAQNPASLAKKDDKPYFVGFPPSSKETPPSPPPSQSAEDTSPMEGAASDEESSSSSGGEGDTEQVEVQSQGAQVTVCMPRPGGYAVTVSGYNKEAFSGVRGTWLVGLSALAFVI